MSIVGLPSGRLLPALAGLLVWTSATFADAAAQSAATVIAETAWRVPPAQGSRLLYVWDNDIPGDVAATTSLLAFALDREIDILAIECSPLGYGHVGAVADYTAFVDAAHAAGRSVLALNGFPWFTVPNGAGVPNQPTGHSEGWSVFETVATSGVSFDGILDDSEPYSTDSLDGTREHNYFWENLPISAQGYLDYLHGLRGRIGSLPFYSTIPYWYDEDPLLELVLDGETSPHPLNVYVSDIVDVVNVLDYRDHALGSGGLVAHARGELQTAPLILGLNTCDIGIDAASFWEEGSAAMELEIAKFGSYALLHDPAGNLVGFAFHDYECYSSMNP